jgi:hypothetical protein
MYNKHADVVGTVDMPLSAAPGKKPEGTLTTIRKSAEIGHLVSSSSKHEVPPDIATPQAGEHPGKLPQAKMRPHIDVTDSHASKSTTVKQASQFALESSRRYPLDNYLQVQNAVQYFGKYASQMSPSDRREYAINTEKRAQELSIQVPIHMSKCASATYGSLEDLEYGMISRFNMVQNRPEFVEVLGKIASAVSSIDPNTYCELLQDFDKTASIDHLYGQEVVDPFASTFGIKTAEDDNFSDVIGNLMVTARELRALASADFATMKKVFGEEFTKEYHEDPIGIYKSMPVDQKKVLIRMANECYVGPSV